MEELGWSVESGKGEDANVDEPVQPSLVSGSSESETTSELQCEVLYVHVSVFDYKKKLSACMHKSASDGLRMHFRAPKISKFSWGGGHAPVPPDPPTKE